MIHSMHTDAINHEPAVLLMTTGNMVPGKPTLGAWLSYGLGSMNENLPSFVVLNSRLIPGADQQPVSPKLWGSGFLSNEHAGVAFRSEGDPVLYLNDPPGVSRKTRRTLLTGVNEINQLEYQRVGDPETQARIKQYEMAFRMQASVPELTNLADEPPSTWSLYGEDAKIPGTFAYNCLLARRMAERGVRYTQIFQRGWDVHYDAVGNLPKLCAATDRACYALITDLKRRGLLEDTLVIWGGEFGRTVYSQGGLSRENYGRDHHPRCFTMWMAGGGTKPGIAYGATDDYSYNIVKDPGACARSERDGAASARDRSREAVLQVPGAGSETHRRRARASREGAARMTRVEFRPDLPYQARSIAVNGRSVTAALVALIVICSLAFLFPPDGEERGEWLQFIGHFHPLVVHFPIALILILPLLELAARRPQWDSLHAAAGFVLDSCDGGGIRGSRCWAGVLHAAAASPAR